MYPKAVVILMKTHVWQGRLIPDAELDARLLGLEAEINDTLGEALQTRDVLLACDATSKKLRAGEMPELALALERDGVNDPQAVLSQLAEAISETALRKKLVAELGTEEPFTLSRVDYETEHFEKWSPMGVLVHITAGNSPIVAPMASVEGLLSGNINIIKVAGNSGDFPGLFLAELAKYANLGKFIYMLRISSSEKEKLQAVINAADCVSAWGGEEAVSAIHAMTPAGIPVVTWGHKISFGYVTPSRLTDDVCDALVKSVCRNDQQSCSSPQVALIDTLDKEVVSRFASMLAAAFERARALYKDPEPDIAQCAEITTVTELHKAELCFSQGEVIEPKDKQYRLLVSFTPHFMPSPLFRTLWVAPMPRETLIKNLRGMRAYLQTAGLACSLLELAPLARTLYRAGVTRVTPLDSTSASYTGEPHDGVFALPRFLKRVSLRTDINLAGFTSFAEFDKNELAPRTGQPIEGKRDYPPVPENGTRVLMKSGGTTGAPVYCSYSERDYSNYIVRAGMQGFLAAGLDPVNDVVADFFKGGNLYGGLNAMISIFDALKAKHLRISALDDYKLAAKYAITGKATVLIGAPSYIARLMKESEAEFIAYGRVKKIFFGGEHISDGQLAYFRDVFKTDCVRSLLYGANETGTMGYACEHCKADEFHVCDKVQQLEILKMDSDAPAAKGEVGRLIFTGFLRENGRTERYEIGDTGAWLDEERCPCGRGEARFRLGARYGDVMRVGGTFFNYLRISKVLSDRLGYTGRLQIILSRDGLIEVMTLCVENTAMTAADAANAMLSDGYDSFEKTLPTGLMRLDVRHVAPDGFIMNTTSAKLRSIIDER